MAVKELNVCPHFWIYIEMINNYIKDYHEIYSHYFDAFICCYRLC